MQLNDYQLRKIFCDLATVARMSPDPSTQNAAGMIDPYWKRASHPQCNDLIHPSFARLLTDRDAKYGVMVHAEEAACGSHYFLPPFDTMAALWSPCPTCARLIVRSGVKTLYTLDESLFPGGWPERWAKSLALGREILSACDVVVHDVTFPTPLGVSWRWNGQEISV